MSRVSRSQQQAGEQLTLQAVPHPSIGHLSTGRTKETNHKRVSLSYSQAREGSPLGAADPSRPDSAGEGKEKHGQGETGERGIAAAWSVFGASPTLWSVDVHGRRECIDPRETSSGVYEKLLEAARQNAELPAHDLPNRSAPPVEIPEGYKRGAVTGLALPDWWETALGSAPEEKLATIRENLQKAAQRGKGGLFQTFPTFPGNGPAGGGWRRP